MTKTDRSRKKVTRRQPRFPVGGLLFGMLTVVSGGIASDAVKGDKLFSWIPWVKDLHPLIVNGSIIVLFIFSALMLYLKRHQFQSVRSLSQHPCTPHRCVVIPVSTPFPGLRIVFQTDESDIFAEVGDRILKGNNLRDDIEALEGTHWNWQQMMRAIEPHTEKAERLYLIGSHDAKGSTRKGSTHNLESAETLLRKYLPDTIQIKHEKDVDFEDFDEMIRLIEGIRKAVKKDGYSEKNIIIDVTGGQKIPSIVGAVETLNNRLTFQYVQTNPPFHVLAYDVEMIPPIF